MPEFRKYMADDYLRIQRRKFEMLTFLQFPDPNAMARRLGIGDAYTITDNGNIIASGGVVPMWKGVGEGWIVSSEFVHEYKIFFVKTVLRELMKLSEKYERIQTMIDIENVVSMKWAEWMGFECEGLRRKYIGGRDFWGYALVRG